MNNTLLLLLLLAFIIPNNLHASDYTIPDIRVEIQITDNGTVHVKEHLTYVFNGSFSWAEYSLPRTGFSEIKDIRVSEQGKAYINENSEEPGTFSVSERNNSVVIKWHYNAYDTTRIFSLSYELKDALTIGPEYAEFYWNYLSSSRDKPTDRLNVIIALPESVSGEEMYAWSRIADGNASISADAGRYEIRATNLSRRESARVRTVFPATVFNQLQDRITDANYSLEQVLQQEAQIEREAAERAERDAFYASITFEVTLIISLLSIVIFVLLYRKYSRRHFSGSQPRRETLVIPDQNPPALAGRLLTNNMTIDSHLTATIFDLARRGWFIIEEEKPDENKSTGWFSVNETEKSEFLISSAGKNPSDSPFDYEKKTIDFVNKQIDNGKNSFSKIFSDTSTDTAKWYTVWKKEVKKEFDQKNWIDKESYTGVMLNIAGQFLLMAGAIYISVAGTAFAFIALGVTFIMMMGSYGLIRRTKEGEETYHRWKSYRDALKNADKRTVRMEMMDRHFIYATAFNLSEKQINTLLQASDQSIGTIIPWIILAQGSIHTPSSVASAISALAASGTSSFSGVSGGSGAIAGSAGGGASARAG
jgi:uncharacterized membrane protein